MSRLTPKQREWLQWVRDAGGVTDVTDRSIARRVQAKGFVQFCRHDDSYFITPEGRRALEEKHPNAD